MCWQQEVNGNDIYSFSRRFSPKWLASEEQYNKNYSSKGNNNINNTAIQNWPEVYKIEQRPNYKDIKKGFSLKKNTMDCCELSAWGKVVF